MILSYAWCIIRALFNPGDNHNVTFLNLVWMDLDLNDDESTLEDVGIFNGSQIKVVEETANKG